MVFEEAVVTHGIEAKCTSPRWRPNPEIDWHRDRYPLIQQDANKWPGILESSLPFRSNLRYNRHVVDALILRKHLYL